MSSTFMKVKAGQEKAFHAAAVDWESDRQSRIEKSERRAWTVAIAASVVAVSAVVGIVVLVPLKRVVPYVFAVDKATGDVEVVDAVDDRTIVGYQELLDKHWTQRYVLARESYFYKLLQNDYDTVLGLSADDVGREFARQYEGPNARDKKLGPGTEITAKVISVTLAPDPVGAKAVVRFSRATRRKDAEYTDPPQYYVATISYEYKPSMFGREKDLILNPLGYRVTAYRVDAELAPIPNAPAS